MRKDISKEGHRYCQIEDYFQFLNKVKYRDENGIYLETGSSQIPVMQSAVRVITDSAFHRIIEKSDIQKDEIFEHLLSAKTAKERIRALDKAYANATPKVKQYLTYRVERGTAIGGKVKDLNNYVCQTCGCKPFLTRTGKPYAEAHHVTPLHKLENGSMASQNVICVCANCHRKMHFGNVEIIKTTENDITFEINGSMITVRRNKLSAKIG